MSYKIMIIPSLLLLSFTNLASYQCSDTIGVTSPLEVCSKERPCTNLMGRSESETSPSIVPVCATKKEGRKKYDDGSPKAWVDSSGVKRYYCSYLPQKNIQKKKPLLIYFHGAGSKASDVYNGTSLRDKAQKQNFILLSVQGRNLHWPNYPDGSHHDVYHRSLKTESSNLDIAFTDYLVDHYVSKGYADPKRIYTIGWSNGSIFSQLYAIARHKTPTPGGNFVAAGAAYASADPFNNTSYKQGPSCALKEYPQTNVPLYLISRACDAATPCDGKQNRKFDRPPGYDLRQWVGKLKNQLNYTNVKFKILNFKAKEVKTCIKRINFCTKAGGLLNHVRWPDGVADKSGRDWEKKILTFFFDNPYPSH
jgi:predicted esterase